jgi:hypothetical protein
MFPALRVQLSRCLTGRMLYYHLQAKPPLGGILGE